MKKIRRLKLDLAQAYKILHGFDNVVYKNYFTLKNIVLEPMGIN